MDPQLNAALNESAALLQSLLKQLEREKDEMPLCVRGEILEEYLKATELAVKKAGQAKHRLLQLQSELRTMS